MRTTLLATILFSMLVLQMAIKPVDVRRFVYSSGIYSVTVTTDLLTYHTRPTCIACLVDECPHPGPVHVTPHWHHQDRTRLWLHCILIAELIDLLARDQCAPGPVGVPLPGPRRPWPGNEFWWSYMYILIADKEIHPRTWSSHFIYRKYPGVATLQDNTS